MMAPLGDEYLSKVINIGIILGRRNSSEPGETKK